LIVKLLILQLLHNYFIGNTDNKTLILNWHWWEWS
jgi:hypothetical protein